MFIPTSDQCNGNNSFDQLILRDAHRLVDAAQELGITDWMANYNPNPNTGIMFDYSAGNMDRLRDHPAASDHSGASFAICFRKAQELLRQP